MRTEAAFLAWRSFLFTILSFYSTKVLIFRQPPSIAMKELQAAIQLVQAKCIQLNQHPVFKKKRVKTLGEKALPQQVSTQRRPLVSLPVRLSLGALRQRTKEGLKRLESQAERINQLSSELETAVVEFKVIASEVNRDWKAIQAIQEPRNVSVDICDYQAVYIPNVQQKSSGSFVMRSRTIDLFKAEREAALLAQTLRHRARKKCIRTCACDSLSRKR
jgi:hypothetical protein